MSKEIIFSYADSPRYYRCLERQKESIKKYWDGDYQPVTPETYGGPTHNELHLGFKIYIFKELLDKGYEKLLYIDSSLWAINNVRPIFDIIDKQGYYFIDNDDWNVGQWTSDKALEIMGIEDRNSLFDIPSISGGCFGLDLTSQIGIDLFDRIWDWRYTWQCPEASGDGDNRIRHNNNCEASSDKRVLGHRQQAPVSLIAHQLGATNWRHVNTGLKGKRKENEICDVLYWRPGMDTEYKDIIFLANGG